MQIVYFVVWVNHVSGTGCCRYPQLSAHVVDLQVLVGSVAWIAELIA
jgi:hypothetical protein